MSEQGISRRALGGLGVSAALATASVASAQMGDGRMGGMRRELTEGDWMRQVKAQHEAINRGFARVREARGPEKMEAFKRLSNLLAAHSIAEETSLYPAIAIQGDRDQSREAYREQQEAKVLTATIDNAMFVGDMETARRTLDTLQAAVTEHVNHEENRWYPALMRKADARMNAKLTDDFRREFSQAIA